MAWTATVADVFPAVGMITVKVNFTEGAEVGTSKADAMAAIAALKPEIVASLDYAKAAKNQFVGTVIS
jgi:hypothetical protein